MKKLFIFAAGVAVGAVAGAYLVKDKIMADAREEINEVREYYKSKKEESKEEENKEEAPTKEELEQIRKDTEQYEEISRKYTNYNKIENQKQEVEKSIANDIPYIINLEDLGEMEGYDTITLTYFADGVLVDDVDEIVEEPDKVVGLDNLKIFDEFGASAIYVRNDALLTDFEIVKDDWNWSDIQEPPVEKKPHQL